MHILVDSDRLKLCIFSYDCFKKSTPHTHTQNPFLRFSSQMLIILIRFTQQIFRIHQPSNRPEFTLSDTFSLKTDRCTHTHKRQI